MMTDDNIVGALVMTDDDIVGDHKWLLWIRRVMTRDGSYLVTTLTLTQMQSDPHLSSSLSSFTIATHGS